MKYDGGPAFPIHMNSANGWTHGMSLRDYFAGQALSGLMSDPKYDPSKYSEPARVSYLLADAMIAERNK